MYAIQFETDVKTPYIKIPDYQKFKSKHVKVVLMAEDKSEPIPDKRTYFFDDLIGKLKWRGNPVSAQRSLRNEW